MREYKKYLREIYTCFVILCIFLFPENIYAADRNFNQTADISIAENEDYAHTQQYTWCVYKAPNNGYITITAGNGASAAKLQTSKRYVMRGGEIVYHAYSVERVQPGTYYVKIEPANKTSSGYYTLKWK